MRTSELAFLFLPEKPARILVGILLEFTASEHANTLSLLIRGYGIPRH